MDTVFSKRKKERKKGREASPTSLSEPRRPYSPLKSSIAATSLCLFCFTLSPFASGGLEEEGRVRIARGGTVPREGQ